VKIVRTQEEINEMKYNDCPNLDENLPLATAFVRIQRCNEIYDSTAESLARGTVFPVLYNAGYSQPKEDVPCLTNK
jgi:hypothetical protein